jgi:mannobiose 2-epimerase
LSKAYQYDPSRREFLDWARHGFRFLEDTLKDKEHGGYFYMVTPEGVPIRGEDEYQTKTAYGHAFLIYALAALARASDDAAVLEAAKECFRWLDAHAHDPVHGGYYQFLTEDGTPMKEGYKGAPPKDQNSSIHLLEGLTELYLAWPDPVVRERLEEMLALVRDTIPHPDGYLRLFFSADWQAISHRDRGREFIIANSARDHVTLGHDVETAYLMLEAAEALGQPDDPKTLQVAKRLVDHALEKGWDPESPGFADRYYYFEGEAELSIIRPMKNWWTQAEAMNTFLLFAKRFPTDPMVYEGRFLDMWNFIQAHLIDHEHGGWYEWATDISPERKDGRKGHIWKSTYHNSRALLECIRWLEE